MKGDRTRIGLKSIGYDLLFALLLFLFSFLFTILLGMIMLIFVIIGDGFALVGTLFFLLFIPILVLAVVLFNNKVFSRIIIKWKGFSSLFQKKEVDYRCIEGRSILNFILLKISSLSILIIFFFFFAFISAVTIFISQYQVFFLLPAYPLVIVSVLLPAVTWVMIAYSFDAYDPEPRTYVLMGILWGMFSTFPSLFLNSYNSTWMPDIGLSTAVVSAPIFEELFKLLGFIFVFSLIKHESDGIVYGAAFGAGFAMLENFFYSVNVILGSDSNTALGFTLLLFFRSFFNILLHMAGPVMMGFLLGSYIRKRNISKKTGYSRSVIVLILIVLAGYLFSIGIHALWNFLAGTEDMLLLLLLALGFMVFIYFFAMATAGFLMSTYRVYNIKKENRDQVSRM